MKDILSIHRSESWELTNTLPWSLLSVHCANFTKILCRKYKSLNYESDYEKNAGKSAALSLHLFMFHETICMNK